MLVVTWLEANPADSTLWSTKARAFAPSAGAWETKVTDVSDGWFIPANEDGLAQPVMGPDGLFVAAWTAQINPSSSLIAQYSATRSPGGTWSMPVQISSSQSDSLEIPWLALEGGTTIAAWERTDAIGQDAIFANSRDAGSVWGAEAQVSVPWMFDVDLSDLKLWPDGTAVLLWRAEDSGRPPAADEALFWSIRPPKGAWGGGGQGQLGGWLDQVSGVALALRQDGSGSILWATSDASLPTGQQASIQVASRPSGGPDWSVPEVLQGGQQFTGIWPAGVTAGPGDWPAAAAWLAVRTVANPATPRMALFFSEKGAGGHRIYLPLLVR
jgi:hypothetical protein